MITLSPAYPSPTLSAVNGSPPNIFLTYGIAATVKGFTLGSKDPSPNPSMNTINNGKSNPSETSV
jgi:hypothetical protein